MVKTCQGHGVEAWLRLWERYSINHHQQLMGQLAKVYTPNVTWSLHHNIIAECGFEERCFRYYNTVTKGIDMAGMLEDLESIEDGQVLLIQTSAQNPSGVDPTKEQWREIFDMIKKKKHYVFFDSAYQGFASNDYKDDTWSLKTLASEYVRCQLAQSFSKNFGLYGERTGTLSIVCTNSEEKAII